ncbi:MAG: hypothetical protein ACHQRK_00560 [Gemmatimonadales bacterium]
MLSWLLAVLLGLAIAILQYGRTAATPRAALPALLRASASAIVVALLLDAPAGLARIPTADVALDGSMSWRRAASTCAAWPAALDSAARLGGGRWLRFGDSLRSDSRRDEPTDRTSSLRAVADRAAGTGRPVIVITDGELADAELMAALPRGSRAIVRPCAPVADVAVATLDAPRILLAGDSVTARVMIGAGGAGAPAGRLELRLDSMRLASEVLAPLAPFAERALVLRGVVTGPERSGILRAIVVTPGDREPRNDTLALGVDISRAAAAVFVTTAPDFDAREAVAALRGVTSLPTRAYFRVAPGAWRTDGTLAPVTEADVAAAVREAPLVVIHGDTAIFGSPRTITRGALLLFAPPRTDQGEWYASAAPTSPLAAALGSLPFDSLPPLDVAPGLAHGDWQGLVTRRGGSADDRRPALIGWDSPRHIALLGASGLWRWRFRGGVRADAYDVLFGSLLDWLAAGRTDRRAAVPALEPVRAGEPVHWRRGAAGDSLVHVTVTRRSATGRVYSLTLHFAEGATLAESPPLAPGLYDVTMEGGRAVLAVNVSRELIPRRATIREGAVGGAAPFGEPPSTRNLGWLYVAAVMLLCAEWLLRRRIGMR